MKYRILTKIVMCSRYFLFILIVNFTFASTVTISEGFGQSKFKLAEIEISLEKNGTLLEILEHIESKSDFVFSYNKILLGSKLKRTGYINSKNSNLHVVLLSLASEFNVSFKRIGNSISITEGAEQKEPIIEEVSRNVQGKVLDDLGDGLPGVTVLVKGTQQGTITDFEGNFSLDVPNEFNVLVISFTGYVTQEIALNDQTELIIQMEVDLQTLGEVVVVGYGKQNRESISGAVVQAKGVEILKTKAANVEASLAGRIPGLIMNTRSGQPGNDSPSILIRGKGTLGDASPLIVIDGVANRGGFARLNPDDIENISILKDASAAIYGAQSANGVILVTTKRGKITPKQPEVSLSTTYTLSQPTIKPNLMNAVQVLTWEDERNVRSGGIPANEDIIEQYENGTRDPYEWGDTDWWSVLTNQWSPQSRYSLSVRGANEKFGYYVSGGYLDQEAIFKNSIFGYKQYNATSNLDFFVNDNLEFNLSVSGRIEDRLNPLGDITGVMASIYTQLPYDVPYYENGFLAQTENGNPIPIINGDAGSSKSQTKKLLSKLEFNLELPWLIEGLYLKGWAAYDIGLTNQKNLKTPYDIYTYSPSSGEYTNQRAQLGGINLYQENQEELLKTEHIQIGFRKEFDSHSVSVFTAYEQSTLDGDMSFASRNNLVSTTLPYLFTGSDVDKNNGGVGWNSARQNYFGRFNYTFDNRYIFEFTLRHDGSQNFAPDNRFGTFPGASAAWRISEEDFFQSNFIKNLKLRASIGKLGNDKVESFQYLQTYRLSDYADRTRGLGGYVEWYNRNVFGENKQVTLGLYPSSTPNPAITWETSIKTNIGVDMVSNSGLFDFTLDLFHEKRTGILIQRSASVPEYAGFELPDENLGEVENKGFEAVGSHKYSIGSVNYFVNAQFTYAKNKIVYMDEAEDTPTWQMRTGHPIDYISGYLADGIYNTQDEIDGSASLPGAIPGDIRYVDLDGDDAITANDIYIFHQSPTPEYIYGIEIGFEWKSISLITFIQGQGNASTMYRPWGLNQDAAFYTGRWIDKRVTPNAEYPGAYFPNTNNSRGSTHWIKDNSFMRFRNVELAYSLPESILNKVGLASMRVFINGHNLFLIRDHVKLFDPESSSDTGWYYPQQRLVSTGLNLTF